MKKNLIRTVFFQIRNCHSQSAKTLGLRSEYLPPLSKPNKSASDVTAIVFGSGIEKNDGYLTNFYRKNCGFGTHIASLPFSTVYSYDQASQKEFAKEFIEHVNESNNTDGRILIHVEGCHGFAFYKHFTRELSNDSSRKKIVGCYMNGTPSNIYNKILPFGIPFFYPIPPINLLFRYHGHLKRYSEVKDEEVTREMLFAFSLSDLLINFWKYGPNEWSGNYMLKKENENWPLLFSYNKREPNQAIFIDNLIEFKRSQNDTRSIEGFLYANHESEEYNNIFYSDLLGFVRSCLEMKKKRIVTRLQ